MNEARTTKDENMALSQGQRAVVGLVIFRRSSFVFGLCSPPPAWVASKHLKQASLRANTLQRFRNAWIVTMAVEVAKEDIFAHRALLGRDSSLVIFMPVLA